MVVVVVVVAAAADGWTRVICDMGGIRSKEWKRDSSRIYLSILVLEKKKGSCVVRSSTADRDE